MTNLTKNVLVQEPYTIQKYINEQEELSRKNLTATCPEDKPFTPDHQLCIQCLANFPIFDLSTGLCIRCDAPQQYDPQSFKCVTVNYLTNLSAEGLLETKNYTVENVKLIQDEIVARE